METVIEKTLEIQPVVQDAIYFKPCRTIRMAELYQIRLAEERKGAIDTDDLAAVITFLKANYQESERIGFIISRAGYRTFKELEVSGFFNTEELEYLSKCCDMVQARFLD